MRKYILTLGLLLPTLLFGQIDRSIRPTAAAAPIINIKDSKIFTLDNGITIILSENHKIPRVSFNLVMGSDPRLEREKAGLSDIAGSLILSGTENRTKDELDNEVDYIGATLNADNNSIYLSCLTKHMDKGLTIMADVLNNANFPGEEFERIISQNESGLLAAKSDPGAMASNAESAATFPKGHPYGEIMTEESLLHIDRESIIEYYRQMFTPNGAYLVVVGDINLEETTAAVNQYFAEWQGERVYKEEWGTGKFNAGNRVVFVKKPGAVQSAVNISFAMNIKPGHEDYLKLTVLNSILGAGGFASRLMQNLREDKAYTYGCYSRANVTNDGSWMTAGGNFRNEVTDSAITQILFELDRIIDDYVTDDELSLIKSSMSGSFARSLERPTTVARFALNIIKNELPKDYYQTYLKQLDAVTKEDILMVAQKYFTANKCNIIVVGNEEVLPSLLKFDADGEIEKMDAFGNIVKEVIPSDLTADVILSNYVDAITNNLSRKKLAKKLKKIASMTEVLELTMDQIPFPMTATNVWTSPNVVLKKVEGGGMVFQYSYFDGANGFEVDMQGDTTVMSPEDISAEQKKTGLIPEINYATSTMKYSVTGIEKKNGKDCYVLKLNDGKSEVYEYFNKETFMKVATTSIEVTGDNAVESTVSYGDYVETEGILFPNTYTITNGAVVFKGKLVSRAFNVK
ncbi:MAG: zinc protease [Crocinitomicaceae bacterium]|jgi:zinc protease